MSFVNEYGISFPLCNSLKFLNKAKPCSLKKKQKTNKIDKVLVRLREDRNKNIIKENKKTLQMGF